MLKEITGGIHNEPTDQDQASSGFTMDIFLQFTLAPNFTIPFFQILIFRSSMSMTMVGLVSHEGLSFFDVVFMCSP